MAQLIREKFNPHINVVIAMKENQGYAPETKLKLNTSKVENLGWKPVCSLQEMFDRLIKYLC